MYMYYLCMCVYIVSYVLNSGYFVSQVKHSQRKSEEGSLNVDKKALIFNYKELE